jgi:hypothetical protein
MPKDSSNYHLNLELIVTHPVMESVKNYDINVPQVCINAILKEIERAESITGAVALTTASREMEIQQLKEELRVIREKVEKAEAELKPKFWRK